MNPFLATDGYKTGHIFMYPKGTTKVYSNFTPRSSKHAPKGVEGVLSFGQQMVVKEIHDMFEENFFNRPKKSVITEIRNYYSSYLMQESYDTTHIEQLHDLGYLPIRVKVIHEGKLVPFGVPVLTIENTEPEFFWLTNFLETIISNLLWLPMTSATIALTFKRVLLKYARETNSEALDFVDFQGHDFSMRGMGGLGATMASGLGHTVFFKGSDSLPVIHAAEKYYGANGVCIHSVNATEHSVMSAGSKDGEIDTFIRLLDTFPTGILSVVSDTWDLWKVLTEILPNPAVKNRILQRTADGYNKLVIRPDSGDPADILCGSPSAESVVAHKGVIELLWDEFGGTISPEGYKLLDSRIGAIYGDSITINRCEEICRRLKEKGFASTNVVLGIGSYTYQYNTRDTLGFAMKATYCEVDGKPRSIFKDPVTDDGTKKSARGLLKVEPTKTNNKFGTQTYILHDEVSQDGEASYTNALYPIYVDGHFISTRSLDSIRRVASKYTQDLKQKV